MKKIITAILSLAMIISAVSAFSISVSAANDYARGDVNGDRAIDIFDYLAIKSIYFGKYKPTAEESIRADYNKDGNVDMFDYLSVKAICMNPNPHNATYKNYNLDGKMVNNKIVYQPVEVYYKDEKLVAKFAIINGFDTEMVVNAKSIILKDGNLNVICDGGFAKNQNITVPAKGTIYHEYTFSGEALLMQNADLSPLFHDVTIY